MQVLDSILLVDDDNITCALHEKLLKELGISRQIISTSNGRQALHFIKSSYHGNRKLPSLILSDLSMPEMDGFDFIKEIKTSDLLGVKSIPIGIVTISDELTVNNKLGPEYPLVSKPLDHVKLFHILHNTIVPLLSFQHQQVIMERQRFLVEQKLQLVAQNQNIKNMMETLKKRREELEQKWSKYRK